MSDNMGIIRTSLQYLAITTSDGLIVEHFCTV